VAEKVVRPPITALYQSLSESAARYVTGRVHTCCAGGGGGHDAVSRSRSQSSTGSQISQARPLLAAADAAAADAGDCDDAAVMAAAAQSSSYTVLVLGQPGVGRTALLQQFLTSQFMAAQTTRGTAY